MGELGGRQAPGDLGPAAQGGWPERVVDELPQPGVAGQERRGGEQVGRAQGHGAAARPAGKGGHQHQPVHPLRVSKGQLLGDHAAKAGPEDAGLLDVGVVQDGQDVLGHRAGGEGSRWAVGGADAAVVDGDDLEAAGQPVGHRLPAPSPNSDALTRTSGLP